MPNTLLRRLRKAALLFAYRNRPWVRTYRILASILLLYGPRAVRGFWAGFLARRELWQVPRDLLRDLPLTALERGLRERALKRLEAPDFDLALVALAIYDYPFECLERVPLTAEAYLSSPRLRQILVSSPTVFRDEAQFEAALNYLGRLSADLEALWSRPLGDALRRRVAAVVAHEFIFVPALFSDLNLRPWAERAGRWVEYHLRESGHQLDFEFAPRTGVGRRKIGVLVRDIAPRTETYLTMGFGAGLDPERFETVLLAEAAPAATPFSDFVTQHFERTEQVGGSLARQVETIRALDLDVLILGNTLAAQASRFMALTAHRLARIQVLPSAIAPVTTGLGRIDYVLTGRTTEPASVQEHYSEAVVEMDGPFNCFVLGERDPRLAPPPESTGPTGFAPAEGVIFASGGVINKLTPRLRRCWARLLARVPGSRLVLYPFNQNWGAEAGHIFFVDSLKAGFAEAGIAPERLILHMNLTPPQIVEILRKTTVYLDTFPYSGAASFMEPIAASCPAVTLAGSTQRGLQGAAMLRELGLEDFIAETEDDYVELAVALATYPERRALAAQRMREGAASARFLSPAAFGRGLGAALDRITQVQTAPKADVNQA